MVLHLGIGNGTVSLPVAVVADLRLDGHIDEMPVHFTNQPLTGRHANRQPLLQPDLGCPSRAASRARRLETAARKASTDAVAAYLRAFAAGDLDAIVAGFEPDGYARESVGGQHIHRGPVGLSAFCEWLSPPAAPSH